MTIHLPLDIAEAVKRLSRSAGVSPEQLVLDALRAHFPPTPPDLQAEFDAWERASDEDFVRVEEMLG